ncbi:MAG: PTS sugar transporter subunit IIA [Phycisphaerae bacterium]
MKLADVVCPDAIVMKLQDKERNGVIAELVEVLAKAGKLGKSNEQKITRAVIKRENEASTGLGKGVAVPHVKTNIVKKPIAAVGISSDGIDFDALDKKPVYSVILLVSPDDDPSAHLNAMENIFRHLQKEKFRSFLRQAKNEKDVYELMKEADIDPSL